MKVTPYQDMTKIGKALWDANIRYLDVAAATGINRQRVGDYARGARRCPPSHRKLIMDFIESMKTKATVKKRRSPRPMKSKKAAPKAAPKAKTLNEDVLRAVIEGLGYDTKTIVRKGGWLTVVARERS